MPVIEIRGIDIASATCSALIQCCPDEPFVLVEPGATPQPWTVRLNPDVDELHVTAFGESAAIGTITVPYPPGPRIMMLGDRDFCAQVAAAGESALALLAGAREDGES